MKIKMSLLQPDSPEDAGKSQPLDNQSGSVIVLVLMVLVIMTVIGIMSSDTVVTENQITRNMAIYKQNVNLVESALMQGLQQFLQIPVSNPANFSSSAAVWINNRNANPATNPIADGGLWYQDNFTQRCLTAANSNAAFTLPLLTARGENAGNLRYAIVGWQPVPGQPLTMGKPIWHQGRIVAEYVSVNNAGKDNGFGLLRMEIGVRQQW
jgi:hypothetical protein